MSTSIKTKFNVDKIETSESLKLGGTTVTSLIDSGTITSISTSPSVSLSIVQNSGNPSAKIYDSAELLPGSADSGSMALVTETNRLYIWNGTGWYNIALVNTTPTLSTTPNSNYTLDSVGDSVIVTILATDAEELPITYSTVSDSASNFVTISQDSGVFTITPLTQAQLDSNGVGSGTGTFSITFRASDGVNIAPAVSSFTLDLTITYDWSTGSLQAGFQGSDTAGNSRFGYDLEVSNDGNTIVSGDRQAAIFVHTRSGSTWSQQQKIVQSGVTGYVGYVVSVSGDGDTLAFSDYVHDNIGEVYVWTRSGSTWSQEQIIPYTDADTDLDTGDRFGGSLDLSDDGNTLVIGCYNEDQDGSNTGGVYVFTRSGSTWSFQQRLQSSPVVSSSEFGNSVAISGDGNYIIVGQGSGTSRTVYIFTLSGSTWSQQAGLTPSGLSNQSGFGAFTDISQDGGTAIVGDPGASISGGTNSGAAIVYTRSGSTWSQQAILSHSTAASQDNFGFDVSISNDGNNAVVGAYIDDISSFSDAGSAFVFSRDGSTWTEKIELNSDSPTADEYFGSRVGISGDGSTVAICAQGNSTGGSMAGKVFVFTASES